MNPKLTPEELECLRRLDTPTPEKPDCASEIAERLVGHGLAIRLVEGGLQLTDLGREQLSDEKAR